MVQQPMYIMQKQAMSDGHMSIYLLRTTKLLDPLYIKLCIPIHGNALKAQKNPSVLPQGVICKNTKITAGDAIIVTQIYKEVITEATAQVNTMVTIPMNLVNMLSVAYRYDWNENLTAGFFTKIYLDFVIFYSCLFWARLISQLLNRIDAVQMNYFSIDLLDSTKVQLSIFNSYFYRFYMRQMLYNPVIVSWLSSVIQVPFKFLYIWQYELFLRGVVFAISLLSGATCQLYTNPTQSASSIKLLETKQFSSWCRLFLTQSSPTAKTARQVTASMSDATWMMPQHISAFSDLLDFYAILNKCFSTYIEREASNIIKTCMIDQFKQYRWNIYRSQIDKFQSNIKRLSSRYTEQNHQRHFMSQLIISERRNKIKKRYSSIFVTQNEIKQTLRKSTQQQYDQILKALSSNYFTRAFPTASRFSRFTGCLSTPSTQPFENKGLDTNIPQKIQKFLDEGPFDESKEINKIMKLGDLFEARTPSNYLKSQILKQGQIKRRKMSTLKYRKQNLCQRTTYKKVGRESIKQNRPTTGKTNRRERHYKYKNQGKYPLKFVRIDKKSDTNQISKLRATVEHLENIALDQYGVGVPEKKIVEKEADLYSEFDESFHPKMQELEKKLKQLRPFSQQPVQPEDCSIPMSFLKAVGVKRKSEASSLFNKKFSANVYLRV